MADALVAVKGMNDILPAGVARRDKLPDAAIWRWFERTVDTVLSAHAYRGIVVPVVEPTALFVRGLGEVTDIVEKEMYSWRDAMNGDALTLRPEITAGIVRACIEHSALHGGPLRVWSIGPVFRHERPQKGRYRQFHQLDVEALGLPGPDVDAELIVLCRRLWEALGLSVGRDVRLELNSLGQPAERAAHRAALVAYFEQHAAELDDDARRRLHTNPLRILDTKNPALQPLVEAAPQLGEHLGEASRAHLEAVCAVLDAVGLPYRLNPRLVRGLDYYNLTVFEWVTDRLGAQGTVCGGGRYDGLFEQLGGKPTPAIGFGLGIERLLLLLQDLGVAVPDDAPDAYAVVPDGVAPAQVLPLLDALRRAGAAVQMNAGGGSVKAQFRRADASGARWALVFGADELTRGEVALKDLRDAATPQRTRALAAVAEWAGELCHP